MWIQSKAWADVILDMWFFYVAGLLLAIEFRSLQDLRRHDVFEDNGCAVLHLEHGTT